MHTVKRVFGGFAVVDDSGNEVKTFTGKGAKASAEYYLSGRQLSGDGGPSETTAGRGNHGRGGRGRGDF